MAVRSGLPEREAGSNFTAVFDYAREYQKRRAEAGETPLRKRLRELGKLP